MKVISPVVACVAVASLVTPIRAEAVKGEIHDRIRSFFNRVFDDELSPGYNVVFRYKGSTVCAWKCEQGTIYYPDSSCKCVCRKNYALQFNTRCQRAYWSSWSSWTKCLRSSWGGLQRRERVCKAGGQSSPGSCNGRGSMSRTCTRVTKEYKVRKNLRDLSDEEFHDVLQAMTRFKEDTSKKGYRNIISWHGYPGRCPWYHNIKEHKDNHCSWHHHPMFQPWHRMITVQLELGLSRYLKNKTLGIPYWDWTEHATDLPYLIRDAKIYDPVLKKYVVNPFYRNFIRMVYSVKMYNQRSPSYSGLLMDRYILKGTIRAMMCHDYFNYDEQQSAIPHDQIHDCFCIVKKIMGEDVCDFGMPTVEYAAWDPAFMIHHSSMDRLYVIRRELEEIHGVADWTKSRVIGQYVKAKGNARDIAKAFDWPLSPFCNSSMNPESETGKKGIWTMHNAYYNEQLFGYKYDNYDFGHNYKWADLKKDFERNVVRRNFWNDDYHVTKLGALNIANSRDLPVVSGCTVKYSNPTWNITIKWN